MGFPAPLLLEPPYQEYTPYGRVPIPPMGTIVLAHGIRTDREFAEMMRELSHAIGWAPPVFRATQGMAERWEPLARSLYGETHAVPGFVVQRSPKLPAPSEVIQAVLDRTAPSTELIGHWASERMGRPDLVDILGAACGWGYRVNYPMKAKSLRKRLYGMHFPPRVEWTRLAVLARTTRYGMTPDAAAARVRLSVRRTREWLRHLADVDIDTWIALPGWEWLVETYIRRLVLRTSDAGRRTWDLPPWTLGQPDHRRVPWPITMEGFGLPRKKRY